MKKTFTKTLSLLMVFTILFSACKKDTAVKPDPIPTKTEDKPAFTGTIDGKSFKLDKSKVKNTYYSTDGDPVKSNLTDITLDGSSSMKFFVADMKSGKVDISKKAGTSFNPGTPGVKVMANGAPVLQTYIVYNNAGNAFYAFSGFIKMTIDEDGSFSMEWSLTFKDAAGREFTSTGSVFFAGYKTTVKSKSDIVDPTPVAATPTIENIAPTFGRAGDVISITGTNYSTTMADNVVKINGVDATVVSATATKLEVKAPATGTTGKVSVKVKNSEVKEGPTFTYVPAATLTAISVSHGKVGDIITLTGTNFSTVTTENEVKFNGKAAIVKSATATQLIVEVPQGVETGNITIKTKGYDVTPAAGLDVKFTLDAIVITDPPVNVGTKGLAARISSGPYDFGNRAVDSKGNLYVVDENQQLVKMDYNGNVLKTFGKTEINFVAINNYKCTGLTNDQNGVVHALLSLNTFPNGQVKVYMATISSADVVTKEFETYLYDQSIKGMEVDSKGQYYVLSENYNTPDILKVKKEAVAEKYIQGGAGGAFGGRGAYAMDIDGNDNLYVVAYVKGKYTTDVPTQAAIYKIAPDASITPIISQYTNGYKDGATAEAQFNDIRSIAVSNLDLYVSDNGNFRIRKIATRTGQVSTVGGNGKEFTNGQPLYAGALLSVNMNGSWGLLLDSKNGAIYSFRGSVQKFVF